ncbi:hypothetical protein ACFWY6_06465 [Streptomyces sp. NPDC059037]|uniref:hypothetical protein n=1 Tax=Streptomyces sp. NPDC059037 TaxID=3346710 RepID=UPI0036BC151D
MPFDARVLSVLIASPSDAHADRKAVEGAIRSWNSDHARAHGVVLLPMRWEADAIPVVRAGLSPQDSINEQLGGPADIIIALFHSRLGKPTRDWISGTVEEIEEGKRRNIPVHVYFSNLPHPANADGNQIAALSAFRSEIENEWFFGQYDTLPELEQRVVSALTRDVTGLSSKVSVNFGTSGAALAVSKQRVKAGHQRLLVRNVGDAAADNVRVDVEPVGTGSAPELLTSNHAERIQPNGEPFTVDVVFGMGIAETWRVKYIWEDYNGAHEDFQTVSAS